MKSLKVKAEPKSAIPVWLIATAPAAIALLLGFGLGFVFGHEKRKAINDNLAVEGKKAIDDAAKMKADYEGQIAKSKADFATVTEQLTATTKQLNGLQSKPTAAAPAIATSPVADGMPKKGQKFQTFDETWSSVMVLGKRIVEMEPKQTEQRMKELGVMDKNELRLAAEHLRMPGVANPHMVDLAIKLKANALFYQYNLRLYILDTKKGEDTVYKQICRKLWNPDVTVDDILNHAMTWNLDVFLQSQLLDIASKSTTAYETSDIDHLRRFPGAREWIKKNLN
jgi:hypothetical protein